MDLGEVIRDAVAVVNEFTTPVQEPVQHFPWIGLDAREQPVYAAVGVPLSAIVTRVPGVINEQSGDVIEYSHHLAFLGPIAPWGSGGGRKEPIDVRDRFVLGDGTTSPTVKASPALRDGSTGTGFAFEVWLGVKR